MAQKQLKVSEALCGISRSYAQADDGARVSCHRSALACSFRYILLVRGPGLANSLDLRCQFVPLAESVEFETVQAGSQRQALDARGRRQTDNAWSPKCAHTARLPEEPRREMYSQDGI